MKSPLVSVVAVLAVLPLVAAELWSGFRVALTDPVLAVIAPTEQPLSVRSLVGLWAMLLAVGWFGAAYWHRQIRWWEAALVVLGGAVALARAGNAWVLALAMVMPLARQLSILQLRSSVLAAIGAASVVVGGYAVISSRPPQLPSGAAQAVVATSTSSSTPGNVFADWRWATALRVPIARRHVLGAGGLASESPDFWVDYLRVAEGHERWAEVLDRRDVDVLVLDSTQEAAAADLVRASGDWRVTFDADNALVAVRTGS